MSGGAAECIQRRFGNRIRLHRREQGLSQEALALLCGLDRSYIGAHHCVVGFAYQRLVLKKAALTHSYRVDELNKIPLPFDDVQTFVNEKWRISSDRAGSGNTTNIGSIKGTLDDFVNGRGVFESEDEFLEYWRGYEKTSEMRRYSYSNVAAFRRLKKI
jgi:hypothetical protein